jgi:hypothetical protein|tara:strand:- start:2660 stop:3046 length:387 start_codon:yes stop_codon:yes gene_type:complete
MINLKDFLNSYVIANNINRDEFISPSRKREIVDSRMIYCVVARNLGGYTLSEIGRSINRDHATVLYAIRNYDHLSNYDESMKHKYYKASIIYRTLEYKPKAERVGLIDTLFETNRKLRQRIAKLEELN